MSLSKADEPPTTEEVWKEFAERLRHFLRKRMKNDADAEDVLQDVFQKIHRGLGRLENVAKLEAWVHQIARRALLDHFRSGTREQALGNDLPEIAEEPPAPPAPGEFASCVRPMLEALSAQDREAIRLADLEGMTQRELAERLGLSFTGAKSRVQRARRRLKALLLDCCDIVLDRRRNVVDYTQRRPGSGTCECDSVALSESP